MPHAALGEGSLPRPLSGCPWEEALTPDPNSLICQQGCGWSSSQRGFPGPWGWVWVWTVFFTKLVSGVGFCSLSIGLRVRGPCSFPFLALLSSWTELLLDFKGLGVL